MLDVVPLFCFCCAEIITMLLLTLLVDVSNVEILNTPDAITL